LKTIAYTIDLDPLGAYYKKRGIRMPVSLDPNLVIQEGLQGWLDLLGELEIKATFFVVGSDLLEDENVAILSAAVAKGHELANHSYSHPPDITTLTNDQLEAEILQTNQIIQEKCAYLPVGFRAPGWNVSDNMFSILAKNKFLYDSSVVPVPFFLNIINQTGLGPIFKGQNIWTSTKAAPYIWEIPSGYSVFPPVSLNHTLTMLLGDKIASLLEQLSVFCRKSLVYTFHGLDLVDGRRFKDVSEFSKPGLHDSLAVKRKRIIRVIKNLSRGRRPLRLCDFV
jgi:hypothetical protein